jgi:two-component system, chemotaxis family, sensor kinase CheA
MDTKDTLIGLVDQAACRINMLSASDLSEAEGLQKLLGQIEETVRRIDAGAAAWQGQMVQTTSDAAQTLGRVLEQQVDDTAKAIGTVGQAIGNLQNLIRQVEIGAASPSAGVQAPSLAAETPGSAESSPAPQGMIISAEDAPLVVDFITEAREHLETAESAMLELENKSNDNELVNKIFRGFHTIKGMAGFLNLTDIGSLAHSAENLLDLARKSKLVLVGSNSDAVFASLDMLKKMIADLKQAVDSGTPIAAQPALAALLETLKAAAEGRNPAPVESPAAAPIAGVAKAEQQQLDRVVEEVVSDGPKAKGPSTSAAQTADDKIKVSTSRLDTLVNMTGELVIAQLMVAEQIASAGMSMHDLARKVSHQGKIVRELQELSMSMRMVPIQGVFQKMARLARDLSHKATKPVDFVTVGEETELDRTVVDKIADPLIHMVRNSIDHGIEGPEDRVKAGKPPTGRVELRAFHRCGSIIIEIEDDGKGLNTERILQKAVEAGLVEAGQDLPQEDIFKLIFHPGLSTAEKITSVSGRGVGMDVVKKNVEALRGRIDISSTRGKGTIFTIQLPLTLAVIDGQIVRIGQARYIIPINSIVRTLRPTREQVSSVLEKGEVVRERDELLPLVRLHRIFNVVPTSEDPTQGLVVVVEEDGKKCCLLVDDLLGQQQVVIKSLGDGMGRIRGVSGGAIMGDGRITLILDVPGLVQLAQMQ